MLMEREDGAVEQHTPAVDPRGLGVAGVLTSDLFGLRSHLDPGTLHDLEDLRRLAAKHKRTSSETKRLIELRRQLGTLDMTTIVRDPLYAQFVRAMTRIREEKEADAASTVEEYNKQLERAVNIVKEIVRRSPGEG